MNQFLSQITFLTLLSILGSFAHPIRLVEGKPVARSLQAQTVEETADRLFQQGIRQYGRSQFREAAQSWQEALKLYQEIDNRAGIADSLIGLGEVSRKLGNYEEAIDYHQRSLAIAEEIGDRAGIANSLIGLGNVSWNLGNYEEARDYYQRSLAIFEEMGDRARMATSLGTLGSVAENLGYYEEAIVFYRESVSVYEQIREDIRGLSPEEQKSYLSTVEDTYRNLADLLMSQGRTLEAQEVLELLKIQEITD